jgi:MFS family permease
MSTGLVLALIQLLFTLTWTIYVVFLPQLAAATGIPKDKVIWILMLDQAIFMAIDFALGVNADKMVAATKRLAAPMMVVTGLSTAAFVLLPHADTSAGLLLTLTIVWAVTSSALRAPPMVMFARYVSAAAAPRFVFLSLLGIGVAGSLAPWLTAQLGGLSPTMPFLLAGVGLLGAVSAMAWCEQRLVSQSTDKSSVANDSDPTDASAHASGAARTSISHTARTLFAAVLLLGLGFQIHAFLNSVPAYLRFAKPDDLVWLMGLFWVGFSFAIMAPAVGALKRFSAPTMLVIGTAAGSLAMVSIPLASSLPMLIGAQLIAGAAWGLIIGYAFSAAIDAGRTGREGKFTGMVFAVLAAAALTRFAIVLAGVNKAPDIAPLFAWLPAISWSAALLLLVLAVRSGRVFRR